MKKTLVYVASSPRSGSTLISNLLGNHKNIFNVGEICNVHAFLNNGRIGRYFKGRCSCGTLLRKCTFWGPIISKALEQRGVTEERFYTRVSDVPMPNSFNKKNILPSKQLKYFLNKSAKSTICKEIAYNCYSMLDNVVKYSNNSIIVDSSKNVDSLINYLNYKPDDWDVYVIHIIRDPRATAWSNIKGCIKAGVKEPNFFRCLIGTVRQNIMISKLANHTNIKSFQRVEFEKFCRDPENTIRTISENMGVYMKCSDLSIYSSTRHDIAGSRSVLPGNHELNIKLDESWKMQVSLFKRFLGWLLICFIK